MGIISFSQHAMSRSLSAVRVRNGLLSVFVVFCLGDDDDDSFVVVVVDSVVGLDSVVVVELVLVLLEDLEDTMVCANV